MYSCLHINRYFIKKVFDFFSLKNRNVSQHRITGHRENDVFTINNNTPHCDRRDRYKRKNR